MAPADDDLISLVIPLCDEAESLPSLFAEIAAATANVPKRFELIAVDDGSRDDSWAIITAARQKNPLIRGIRFRRNFGKAAALAAGFAAARGSIIFTLDADLQDDPVEIPRFLDLIGGGYDVVSGWKKIRHDPWHKVFPSHVFNAMVSRMTGVKLHDHNCGYKVYRAEVLREVRLYGERHRFVPVLAAARGFRVGELIIHHRPRKFGRSHYGVRRFIKGFLDLLTVKFLTGFGKRPQHALGGFGIAPLGLGVFGIVVLLLNAWLRCVDSTAGIGPLAQMALTVISVGLMLTGGMMFLAGLLAEMIVERSPEPIPPYSIAEATP